MLLAIKLLGRWLTLETGKVGDDNEPEVEKEESEKEEEADPVIRKVLGFSIIDPYEVSVDE